MAGTMKFINEYLTSHCGVVKTPLAHMIGETPIMISLTMQLLMMT